MRAPGVSFLGPGLLLGGRNLHPEVALLRGREGVTLGGMQTLSSAPVPLQAVLWLACLISAPLYASAPKVHSVTLGSVRKVPYTPPAASSGAVSAAEPAMIKVRALMVDGHQKEWTTGDLHEVTDRSFTIRRALRLNDALPGEAGQHWSWQPGPWLLVDRTTGHITALHLPEFDSLVSEAVWFRDYAAYCGAGTTAKGGLFAVVAQLGVRRPVVQKQIGRWPLPEPALPVCKPAEWKRDPLRVTIQPVTGEAMTFDVVGAAVLVEDGDVGDEQ